MCACGSQVLLCALKIKSQKKNVIKFISGSKWGRVWCVAVVTVVWPVSGSALGPVEWLKALNTVWSYQPCCLCVKAKSCFSLDLIIWKMIIRWHSWTLRFSSSSFCYIRPGNQSSFTRSPMLKLANSLHWPGTLGKQQRALSISRTFMHLYIRINKADL